MRRSVEIAVSVLVLYFLLFAALLWNVWPTLDPVATVGIVSVLAGGLAGVIGSSVAGLIRLSSAEKESEDRLKDYASAQALELTQLEFELRRATGQRSLYAPAKVYREFYKALFELYTTRQWPQEIQKMGLLNILQYDASEDSKNTTTSSNGCWQRILGR